MSFAIALSGLDTSSTRLDVISHNISNSATNGFKRSRVEFTDVYTAMNERGVGGQGDKVAIVRQKHASGNLTDTGKALDLSVDGSGYFRLVDDSGVSYTRNGAFAVDRQGFIINADGLKLTGYRRTVDGALSPTITELFVDPADQQPNPTSSIDLGVNLHSTAEVMPPFDVDDAGTYNFTTSKTIYDTLGSPSALNIYYRKEAQNTWTAFTYLEGVEISQAGGDEIVFGQQGEVATVNGTTDTTVTIPPFLPNTGGSELNIEIKIDKMSQYNSIFGVNQIVQDGYPNGRLNDISIEEDGTIQGRYSNGQSQTMGQVILANFANREGLHQVNGTAWRESYGSGSALLGQPGSSSLGRIRSGALEESNVDVTKELVSMISAQRTFQANAQVISTYDTVTQTVINMRR